MPLLRGTLEFGLNRRLSLVTHHLPQINLGGQSSNHLFTCNSRNVHHRKWHPNMPGNQTIRAHLQFCRANSNWFSSAKCSNRAYLNFQLLAASAIKERIYDKLILFTRMLHQQSNVYLCLRLRRLSQICNLYRRLYSPNEFSSLVNDLVLERLRNFGLLLQQRSVSLLLRRSVLLSFVSVGLFAWEENRITDQELNELMEEFLVIENAQTKNLEDHNESYGSVDVSNIDASKQVSEECSFMTVNCLQRSPNKWEVVINQPNFHVWRKSINDTSLYEYKVFGSFFDISAYSFYAVQRDLEFRKEWDKLVLKLNIIQVEPNSVISKSKNEKKIDDSGNELVHWIMKYPYPMKSREYVYIRRSQVDYERKFIVCISRSVQYTDIPETDEHVRVYDYMSQMVIRPHQDDFYEYGFDYMLTYFDDPRASFPSPAYNWMASRGVPDFVEKLHQAALRLSLDKRKHSTFSESIEPEDSPEIFVKPDTDSSDPNDASISQSSEQEKKTNTTQATTESSLINSSPNPTSHSDRNRKSGKNKETNTFNFKSLSIWS